MNASNSVRVSTMASRPIGLGVAAVCALLLIGLSQTADAQTKLRGPRDIAGLWSAGNFGFSFDTTVKPNEPQKVQLQPEYEARYKAVLAATAKGEAEGKPLANSLTLCLPQGMPTMMGAMFPMEIVVSEKTAYVLTEGTDPPRRIYLDGRSIPPLDNLEPSYEGYSVGRWEGNTLLVDTAGLKTSTTIDNVPHSNEMRINERIRLVDDDTMEIVFTVTDPEAFKAPWVMTRLYRDYNTMTVMMTGKKPGTYPDHKGVELVPHELVCDENNRNIPGADGVTGFQLGSSK